MGKPASLKDRRYHVSHFGNTVGNVFLLNKKGSLILGAFKIF